VACAPAGIVAPFAPVTALASVAVNRSPTWLVFVQTFEFERSASVVPAGIDPTPLRSPAPAFPGVGVAVFPLGVTVGAGAGAGALGVGRGGGVVVRGRVRTVVPELDDVVRGRVAAGAGAGAGVGAGVAAGGVFAGTS